MDAQSSFRRFFTRACEAADVLFWRAQFWRFVGGGERPSSVRYRAIEQGTKFMRLGETATGITDGRSRNSRQTIEMPRFGQFASVAHVGVPAEGSPAPRDDPDVEADMPPCRVMMRTAGMRPPKASRSSAVPGFTTATPWPLAERFIIQWTV